MMRLNVDFARSFMTIVVAAAGNEGEEVDELSMSVHPCQTVGTICVADVHNDLMNAGNFGDDVDIWAPFDTLTTPTPGLDCNRHHNFGQDELQVFRHQRVDAVRRRRRGLMKSGQSESELVVRAGDRRPASDRDPSPDPRVRRGIIDVYRACAGRSSISRQSYRLPSR